jgi:hypothetical protein
VTVLAALVPKLADLPGVVAVVLGGSRARGTHRPDSDWDIGVYYRGSFDARRLAQLGYDGHTAQPGEWGRIVNGGAWISVEGQPVDVLLRDLDVIDGWRHDAQVGRFDIDNVEGHIAGLPTYTAIGEIAIAHRLVGELPEATYPDALRTAAGRRWRWNSAFSLLFAEQYAARGDSVLTTGMLARATVQSAHAVLAERGEWALNEKRIVEAAGLTRAHEIVATSGHDLPGAVAALRALLDPPPLDELSAHHDAP